MFTKKSIKILGAILALISSFSLGRFYENYSLNRTINDSINAKINELKNNKDKNSVATVMWLKMKKE